MASLINQNSIAQLQNCGDEVYIWNNGEPLFKFGIDSQGYYLTVAGLVFRLSNEDFEKISQFV